MASLLGAVGAFSSRQGMNLAVLRRFLSVSVAAAALAVGVIFIALHANAVTAPRTPESAPARSGAPRTWPAYQYFPSHNAVFAGGLRANWLTKLGDRINGGLAVVDGTVFAVSFDKSLYALDEASGSVRWSAAADNVLMSTPIVTSQGLVIVGSGKDGFLKPDDADSQVWGRPAGDDVYAFDARDGKLAWKFHTVGQNMPSPALDGDAVVFANGDAHAYAIDARSAQVRWETNLPGVATMASMSIHDGLAFASTCHNAPYVCETRALDVRTGRTVWTNPHGGSDCTPTVDAGLVFVNATTAEDRPYRPGGRVTVAAIEERTGKTKWSRTFGRAPFTYIASSERQIAGTTDGGTLYQSIGNLQEVVAMDERTGKLRWRAHTSANVKMSPVVKDDRVYFGDTAGIFYAVDRRSGRVARTISFLQPFSVSSPVIDGETLFVADGSMVIAMPLSSL